MKAPRFTLIILSLACLSVNLMQAQETRLRDIAVMAPRPDDVGSIDGMIKAWYEIVSGPKGQPREWARDKSLYMPGLRFVTVGGKDGAGSIKIQSHAEYVEASDAYLQEGFFEREIFRTADRFGNIAHVWSTYESRRTENGPVIARGINSIEMYWDGKRWWIANAVWTEETPVNPIPPAYLPTGK